MVTIVYLTEFPSFAKYEFSWYHRQIYAQLEIMFYGLQLSKAFQQTVWVQFTSQAWSAGTLYVNSHIYWISLEEEVHTSKQWINTKTEKQRADHTDIVQYTKHTETVKYKHMEKLHGIRL